MLILARVALGDSGFTLGGTMEVIAIGLLFGSPGALVFAVIRKKIGTPSLWKGALFGLLFFIILVLIPPPAAVSASSGLRNILHMTLTLFGILFMAYGVIVELFLKKFGRQDAGGTNC
jgi:hypothetical protein